MEENKIEESKREPLTEEKINEFFQKVSSIEKQLVISNSIKRKFILATVGGLGYVIGATFLVAVVVSILSFLGNTNIGPFDRLNMWMVHTLEKNK